MAITEISRDQGINVSIVRLTSSDSIATVFGADYLTAQNDNITALNNGEWTWLESDAVMVYASDGHQLGEFDGDDFTTLVAFPVAGNGAVALPVVSGNFTVFDGTLGGLEDLGYAPSDPTKTTVVMAGSTVVVGRIAHFIDTAGTIDDTAGAVSNLGNILAGASGTAGTLTSFPATAANGSLILAAVNAGGAFNTTISNGVVGQSSVYTLSDIVAATGAIPVSTGAVRMKMVADAAAAGGSATQNIVDAFCTAASVVLAIWQTQANPAVIQRVVPGAGSFDIISDVDAGAGTVNYVIMK